MIPRIKSIYISMNKAIRSSHSDVLIKKICDTFTYNLYFRSINCLSPTFNKVYYKLFTRFFTSQKFVIIIFLIFAMDFESNPLKREGAKCLPCFDSVNINFSIVFILYSMYLIMHLAIVSVLS